MNKFSLYTCFVLLLCGCNAAVCENDCKPIPKNTIHLDSRNFVILHPKKIKIVDEKKLVLVFQVKSKHRKIYKLDVGTFKSLPYEFKVGDGSMSSGGEDAKQERKYKILPVGKENKLDITVEIEIELGQLSEWAGGTVKTSVPVRGFVLEENIWKPIHDVFDVEISLE